MSRLGLDPDGSLGTVDHALAEGKAQPVAGAPIGGEKGLEDARLRLRADTDAPVTEEDAALAGAAFTSMVKSPGSVAVLAAASERIAFFIRLSMTWENSA